MGNQAAVWEPDGRLSREEYLNWVEQQPSGKFERIDGVVVAMAPERIGHNRCKNAAYRLLHVAARQAGLPCEILTDRVSVQVDESDFEPDVILRCGPRLPDNALAVPDPLVIVEVLSPTTSGIDRSFKLREYFRLPSLRHYLIVWPDTPRVVRHTRTANGQIAMTVFTAGEIQLDPPGISVQLEALYEE